MGVRGKNEGEGQRDGHAVLVASPGMGHLIPMVELGKRLLAHHAFHVTIFAVTTTPTPTPILQRLQPSASAELNIVTLPIDVSVSGSLGEQVGLTMFHSLPLLRSSIHSITPTPTALIVDIFGTLAFPIARDLRMSAYVFFTTSAWFSALTIYSPLIDKQMEHMHAHHRHPLYIPGCQPVQFEDTLEPFLCPDGPIYEGFSATAKDIISADGILVNTWHHLEPSAAKALTDAAILARFAKGPVYPVGPMVRCSGVQPRPDPEAAPDALMSWLHLQPAGSVVYVSFGSGGTMSEAQTRELALGLELAQHRFIWVVRPPRENDASGAFFDVGTGGAEEAAAYLPEGFLERTKEVGVVVPAWAPQAEILAHPSTGAFVTHCGWNSVLESLLNGVPMVAWPLYSEQKMNASLLSEQLGVAVRAPAAVGGVVGREVIAMLVSRVMVGAEGMAMRKKARDLKLSGESAVSVFGSSFESLREMSRECRARSQKLEVLN